MQKSEIQRTCPYLLGEGGSAVVPEAPQAPHLLGAAATAPEGSAGA